MIAWGIDAGTDSIKFVKLSVIDGKVGILETGLLKSENPSQWGTSLGRFWDKEDIKKDSVAVGIPGSEVVDRFVKLPPIEAKRVKEIIEYEAAAWSPFSSEEVDWFYHLFKDPLMPDTEAGIFAIKKDMLAGNLQKFEDAGFECVHMAQSTPLALYNALHHVKAFGEDTTIVLDIGHSTSHLIIATEHTIWTRSIQIGVESLIEELMKSFRLSAKKAQDLLQTVETSKYARQIFQTMRPVFADLVRELQRSIGFYSSIHRDTEITQSIIVGGGSNIPGLSKYIEQNLNVSGKQTDEEGNLIGTLIRPQGASKVSPNNFGKVGSQHWVAYGLALQAAGLAEISEQFIGKRKNPVMNFLKSLAEISEQFIGKRKNPISSKNSLPTLVEYLIVIAVFVFVIVYFSAGTTTKDEQVLNFREPNQVQELGDTCSCGSPLDEDGDCLRLITHFGKDAARLSGAPHVYALILVETTPEGGVKVTPEYNPEFNEYGSNPLSHQVIKKMMERHILGETDGK